MKQTITSIDKALVCTNYLAKAKAKDSLKKRAAHTRAESWKPTEQGIWWYFEGFKELIAYKKVNYFLW